MVFFLVDLGFLLLLFLRGESLMLKTLPPLRPIWGGTGCISDDSVAPLACASFPISFFTVSDNDMIGKAFVF